MGIPVVTREYTTRLAGPPVTQAAPLCQLGVPSALEDAAWLGDGCRAWTKAPTASVLLADVVCLCCGSLDSPASKDLRVKGPRVDEVSSKNFQNPRRALVLREISLTGGDWAGRHRCLSQLVRCPGHHPMCSPLLTCEL